MAPPTVTHVDCLILDLFGVVVSFDDKLVYDRIGQHCANPEDAAEQMRDLVSNPSLIRGKTTLAAVHARLVSQLGLRATLQELERIWLSSYSEPMPGMRGLLRELSVQCRLVLLSNVDRYYWPTVYESVPELQTFHARLLSFEQGVAKPDAEAFTQTVARAGVPIENCYFIDDKPENIGAAASLGLAGHAFANVVALKAALRQRGLHVG